MVVNSIKPTGALASILSNRTSGIHYSPRTSIKFDFASELFAGRTPSLNLGEGKIHGAMYYTVEPKWLNWKKIETWAKSVYGEPGDIWSNNCERWYMNNQKFWFRKEADLTLFILKWS